MQNATYYIYYKHTQYIQLKHTDHTPFVCRCDDRYNLPVVWRIDASARMLYTIYFVLGSVSRSLATCARPQCSRTQTTTPAVATNTAATIYILQALPIVCGPSVFLSHAQSV